MPPTINKYYVIDLAEQRSLVEHLVADGQQVYCISWRNPDARHADWGLDTYGQAIIEAMDAAEKISRQDQVALLGICSGGMLASMVLAHLAAIGDLDRVAAFSLAVTVLDQEQAGLPSALLSHKAAAASTRASQEKGYLDGQVLAEVFAWLRPNDLIWNYWVNNYLLGHAPKAFDILYWNADPVRMTAAMHRDFMDLAIRNASTQPGARARCSAATSTSARSTPTPTSWPGSPTTSASGSPATRPPSCSAATRSSCSPPAVTSRRWSTRPATPRPASRPRRSNPADAAEWLESASKVKGSWWDDYVDWLAERTGPERNKPTPDRLGGVRAALRRPGHLCPRPLSRDRLPHRRRCAASRPGSRCAPPAAGCVDEPPLLLCNGIGASLEALQPFVDALDPDRGEQYVVEVEAGRATGRYC